MSGIKNMTPVKLSILLDLLHLVLGIAIVGMSIICFINPEEYELLFTMIFLLASILNISNGLYKIRGSEKNNTVKVSGILSFIFGMFLLVITVISAICFFGR